VAGGIRHPIGNCVSRFDRDSIEDCNAVIADRQALGLRVEVEGRLSDAGAD
jgi:hypothetical protein